MPNNQEVLDIKPQNLSVTDVKPNNTGELLVPERQYTLILGAGMMIPLGGLLYPVSQTIISPVSP